MFHSWKVLSGLVAFSLLAVGCQTQTPPPKTAASSATDHDHSDGHHEADRGHDEKEDAAVEATVSAILAKLSDEDRQLAEAQKFCAVMSHERLGGMGAPLKFEIKGEPVFVCCKGCQKKALKNPEETLAKVAAMKASHQAR